MHLLYCLFMSQAQAFMLFPHEVRIPLLPRACTLETERLAKVKLWKRQDKMFLMHLSLMLLLVVCSSKSRISISSAVQCGPVETDAVIFPQG